MLGNEAERSPTVNPHRGRDLGGGRLSSATSGGRFPGVFWVFWSKRVFGGRECPGEEFGFGDIGGGHDAWEGITLPHPKKEAAVPLRIIRGYFWRLKGLEGDR